MPSRVPPGQITTKGSPVVHAGSIRTGLSPENWSLSLHGEVDHPMTLSYSQLLALPQKEITCDIHCVTSWTKLGMHWRGVPFSAIADAVSPRPTVWFVILECEQGFMTSLPYEAARDDDVLIAHSVEGGPLPPEHGGPVRALVPSRYFYKSAKWLRGLRFAREDEPGFWEVRGYSNIADPWAETRYDVDDVKVIHRVRKRSLFRPVPPENPSEP
ncbi:MAG: molybdopterin-dependent oxidoreductase [Thermoplasmata archaeon]|jgi:DMSO/TMAO reductase YedYZ molybdopterin-dependent catalytic subunit